MIGLPHSTAPCPILIMPSSRLGTDKHKPLKSMFWFDQHLNLWGSNFTTYQKGEREAQLIWPSCLANIMVSITNLKTIEAARTKTNFTTHTNAHTITFSKVSVLSSNWSRQIASNYPHHGSTTFVNCSPWTPRSRSRFTDHPPPKILQLWTNHNLNALFQHGALTILTIKTPTQKTHPKPLNNIVL